MSKFKVGDRVRVIEPRAQYVKAGQFGTLEEEQADGLPKVKFDTGESWYIMESNLEAVTTRKLDVSDPEVLKKLGIKVGETVLVTGVVQGTWQVGDWVQCKTLNPHGATIAIGQKGVIVSEYDGCDYRVSFEDHIWYVQEEDLTRISSNGGL